MNDSSPQFKINPFLSLRIGAVTQVLIGGGENHRMGLFDMVMVKDNHIAVAGGIQQAISTVEKYLRSKNLDIGVEVQIRSLTKSTLFLLANESLLSSLFSRSHFLCMSWVSLLQLEDLVAVKTVAFQMPLCPLLCSGDQALW